MKHLPILLWCAISLSSAVLVAQIAILAAQTLRLLLQGLQIAVLLGQFFSQATNFPSIASVSQLVGLLSSSLWVTLVLLDLLLKTQDIEDHSVCAVEDQGEEKGETAEVHVALGVELAGLDFHALVAKNCGSTGLLDPDFVGGEEATNPPWFLLDSASSSWTL